MARVARAKDELRDEVSFQQAKKFWTASSATWC